AGGILLAERHEDLPIGRKLGRLLAVLIRHPNVVLFIEREPVRLLEHARAEALEQFARRVELENGRILAMERPQVPVRIEIDRDDLSPLDVGGQFRPALHQMIRIRLRDREGGGQQVTSGKFHDVLLSGRYVANDPRYSMAMAKATGAATREVKLRVVLRRPPAGVDFGVQKGQGNPYETILTKRSA